MPDPKISILTTAYNAGPYLADAIDSVLRQDFGDWELVLVNNGSDDGSFEKLDLTDFRIRFHHIRENIGRTPALQFALSLAQGEYVAILDADDVAAPERLRLQSEFLDLHPEIGIVASHVERIDADGNSIGIGGIQTHRVELPDEMGFRNVFVNSSTMYRRVLAVEFGGYDPHFQYAQDYDLAIRLIAASAGYIFPRVLTKHRVHLNSVTSQSRRTRLLEEFLLAKKAALLLPLSAMGREMNYARQFLTTTALSVDQFRQKRFSEGLRNLRGAVTNLQSMKVGLHILAVIFRKSSNRSGMRFSL